MGLTPNFKHAFTRDYPGKVNQLITEVFVLQGNNPIKYKALWDTGATNCAVSNTVIADLGLTPIDAVNVIYGDGERYSNVYVADILLPNDLVIKSVRSTWLHIAEESHNHIDMLIGMDVISLGDLAITNYNNKTTISFVIPSCARMDFVPMCEKENIENFGNRKPRRNFKP